MHNTFLLVYHAKSLYMQEEREKGRGHPVIFIALVFLIVEKASSFVGTAEYVSPELLQSKVAYKR